MNSSLSGSTPGYDSQSVNKGRENHLSLIMITKKGDNRYEADTLLYNLSEILRATDTIERINVSLIFQ